MIPVPTPPAPAGTLVTPTGRPTPLGWLAVALFALAGAGAVLWMTARHGPGLSADAVGYVAAARGLAAGAGWISFDGRPVVNQPPGLATVLALGAVLGVDPAVGVRYLNALAFGLTLLLAGLWLLRHVRARVPALAALAALLLSQPLLRVAGTAWTEALFIVLVTGALAAGGRYLETGRPAPLGLCGLLTGLACATRYAGAPLFATGLILIALRRSDPGRRRLARGAVFTALSVLPVALWMARNRALAGTALGDRRPAAADLPYVLARSWDVVGTWFAPTAHVVGVRWLAGLALGAVLVLAAAGLWAGRGRPGLPRWRPVVPLLVFGALYWAFIVAAKTRYGTMEARYMLPLVVPVFLALALGLDRALAAGRAGFGGSRAFAVALPLCVLVWLAAYPAPRALGFARLAARDGLPGYTADYWQRRPVVQALAGFHPDGHVLSNAPDLVYWRTGAYADWVPPRSDLAAPDGRRALRERVAARLAAGEPVYLVLVRHERRPHLADLPELAPLLSLRVLWADPDGSGAVFRIEGVRPEGAPATVPRAGQGGGAPGR